MRGVDALNWFNGEQFKSARCFQYSSKLIGLFVDHMELRAVCHANKRYSTGEALNIIDDEEAIIADDDAESDGAQLAESPYPHRISKSELIQMVRARLERRRDKWQAFWPFELTIGERGYCTLSFNSHHTYAISYLYFLMALYAKYLQGGQNLYRNIFENICFSMMRHIYPAELGWEVRQIGAATAAGGGHNNLQNLAVNLCLSPPELRRRLTKAGDGGIDLVAFHKWEQDDLGCLPFLAMQCSCSADIEEMERKAHEGSYAHLCGILHLDIEHSHILLSPYDWFDPNQPNRIVANNKGAIVFDRARILHNIVNLQVAIELPDSITRHLNEFIQVEENFE